jgi:phospholipid-binding lipoprotein MlaA
LIKYITRIAIVFFLFTASAGFAAESTDLKPAENQHELYHPSAAEPTDKEPAEELEYELSEEDEFYDPFADNETTSTSASQPETISDPFRGFNRRMFVFNDKLYFWVLKPTAQGYKFIVRPEGVRKSIKRFFLNIAMPKRFLNCLFQLKFKGAGVEITRFVLNTTIGIAGFFDPGKGIFNLTRYDEDTGQTFGFYGMGPGFYFPLPFFGPSSGRDAFGLIFDLALDPITYIPGATLFTSMGATLFTSINNTSLKIGEYEDLKKAAIDPYISLRNAYFQNRESAIKQ